MDPHYGKRLKALRESRGLTQEGVAAMLGIAHRQSVAAIESGERTLAAAELIKATEVFTVPLDYFTDRFAVAGEAQFSWRKRDSVTSEEIAAFETRVGRLFGAFRDLSDAVGADHVRSPEKLDIDRNTSVEQAIKVGEELRAIPRLDPDWLPSMIEKDFGIPLLNLDAPRNLSGAVCHLEDMDGIVINREDVLGRRNFDMAHELFHALTWSTMPPEHVENVNDEPKVGRPNKVEQLANAFAGGLLMPSDGLEGVPGWERLPATEGNLVAWVNATATSLGVTSSALVIRMKEVGRIDEAAARKLGRSQGIRMNGAGTPSPPPLPFGRKFVGVLVAAMEDGRISTRKAASLVEMDIDDFGDLCENHGFRRSAI